MKLSIYAKLGIAIVLLTAVTCSTGCAYMKDRALDFADIWTAKAGYGWPVSASINGLGISHVSVGFSAEKLYGFEGRDFVKEKCSNVGVPVINVLAPFYGSSWWNHWLFHDEARWLVFCGPCSTGLRFYEDIDGKDKFAHFGTLGFNVSILSGLWSGRKYCPEASTRFHNVSITACLGFALEVGVNPFELVDFLLGLATFDICKDDAKTKDEKEESTESEEKKE